MATATTTVTSQPGRAEEVAEQPRGGRLRRLLSVSAAFFKRAYPDLLICAAFLLLGFWLTHGLWVDPETHTLALNPDDQILYEWFLAHDSNFWSGDFGLLTQALNYPDGVNLLNNTSVIALGALFAPVTILFGVPATFVLIAMLNLSVTAIAWYFLFSRTMGASRFAAAMGAGLCGFAPSMVSQSNAHLHMTAQWLIPPMIWCVVELVRSARCERVPLRRIVVAGVLFGVLAAVQVFIGEETLFLVGISLVLVTLVYVLLTLPRLRELGVFAAGLAIAVGAAVVLLAYPLWFQFSGPMSVTSGPFSPHYFSADLAAATAFSPMTLVGDDTAEALTTGPAEYNSFFGWPLVLLTIGLTIWLWRNALAVASSLTMLVMFGLSLGPQIVINGERTETHGPFELLLGLPVIDGALPQRFAVACIPLMAVLLVLGLQKANGKVLPVLVVAALLPIFPTPLPAIDRTQIPSFYADGHWRQCAADGEVIVPVPLPTPGDPGPMRYAAAARAAFAVPEGFFIAPYGKDGSATMGTWKLRTSDILAKVAEGKGVPEVNEQMRDDARNDMLEWNAKCLVLADSEPRHDELKQTMELLYGPGQRIADALVWRPSA